MEISTTTTNTTTRRTPTNTKRTGITRLSTKTIKPIYGKKICTTAGSKGTRTTTNTTTIIGMPITHKTKKH